MDSDEEVLSDKENESVTVSVSKIANLTDEQLVNLLEKNPILFSKTQINGVKEKKNKALEEIRKEIKSSFQIDATAKQICKKIDNFKSKCKKLSDSGTPLKKMDKAQQKFHKLLEGEKHPLLWSSRYSTDFLSVVGDYAKTNY